MRRSVVRTTTRSEEYAIGTQRTTFDKLQRERAKKAKAAAKRERRQGKEEEGGIDLFDDTPIAERRFDNPGDVLVAIESLHKQYEAGGMSLDDFDEAKSELYEQLVQFPMD